MSVLKLPILSEILALRIAPTTAISCISSMLRISPNVFSPSFQLISASPKYVATKITVCKAILYIKKAVKNTFNDKILTADSKISRK